MARKTAALIACCHALGGDVGWGESEPVVAAYARFGENLGLAFQVIDDILGIWGREDETGKSARTDILTPKRRCRSSMSCRTPNCRRSMRRSLSGADVEPVLRILEHTGARGLAEGLAADYSRQAMDNLAVVSNGNPALDALHEYTRALLQRKA